ncbi:hypothetical protein L2755_07945 [Shewanella abyssi]|uniref:hypothetical protein n=1 Tax=Shewanella abyssi TaxID=311789 RepID=UPI0020106D55|nr:hypothetical protein [Shewanella abyssi]MCL1049547.1 hypothetical protein [Shewanella abyssi]
MALLFLLGTNSVTIYGTITKHVSHSEDLGIPFVTKAELYYTRILAEIAGVYEYLL